MASVQQYLSVLAGAQSGANADAQRAAAQMQIEVRANRAPPRRSATRRPDAMPYFSFLPSGGGFAPPISPPNNRESPGRVRFRPRHPPALLVLTDPTAQERRSANAINLCMQPTARGQPLEARHFGYGVLQHVVARRWSHHAPQRQELAKLVYDKLSECGAVPTSEPPNPS